MATSYTQTVTGLSASSTYDFQVLGFNGAGSGPVSGPLVVATTAAAAASGPARVLAVFNSFVGTRTMSCQFTELQGLPSITAIQNATGKNLGMVGGDYWFFGSTQTAADYSFNAAATTWWNAGGMATLLLSMPNPTTGGYSGDVSNLDAANLLTPGSASNNALLNTLSSVATGLLALQSAGVTVLLRPYHENNGNWFWWGTNFLSANQFGALWQYTYNYFVNTRGLKNLVWIWSVNAGISGFSQTIPRYNAILTLGNTIDMTGFDVYTSNPGSVVADYNTLVGLGPRPVCMAEFGAGSPSNGDTSFDETTLINVFRNSMPRIVFWQQWWAPWGLLNVQNASAALNDPWVINRGGFTV